MPDSIFPFVQPRVYTDADIPKTQALAVYRDVAWDFAANKPVFVRGEAVIVEGLPAVLSWAWRALHQERYVNELYTWGYGCELPTLVGEQWMSETKIAEAERYIREALAVSPYITGVTDVTAAFEEGTVTVAFVIQTIYGTSNMEVTL